MRNSVKNSIALALVAVLAGCATGGGSTGGGTPASNEQVRNNPLTRLVVCFISLGTACSAPPTGSTASATSSGGSSGSSVPVSVAAPQPQPFTRWENVTTPGTKADQMLLQGFQYRAQYVNGSVETVTYSPQSLFQAPSTAMIGVADNHELVYVGMLNSSDLEFDGHTLPGRPGILFGGLNATRSNDAYTLSPFKALTHATLDDAASHWMAVGALADPYRQAWNYQSFGVWDFVSTSTGGMSASTFGAPTPVSGVPITGAATFTGKLAGSYISAAGEGSLAAGDVHVAVDFGARSLSFASTGTTITSDLSSVTPAPSLDLKGTLTYSAGSASFSGSIVNAAGTMQGTSGGRFYGPAAQELGGTYALKSATTSETMVGAYGAKR